jgi:hypothetical protein
MNHTSLIAVIGVCTCATALMLGVLPSLSVNAEPPSDRCAIVSKQEYDSAKRQKLLRTRFSTYVQTGQLGRRYYWYLSKHRGPP